MRVSRIVAVGDWAAPSPKEIKHEAGRCVRPLSRFGSQLCCITLPLPLLAHLLACPSCSSIITWPTDSSTLAVLLDLFFGLPTARAPTEKTSNVFAHLYCSYRGASTGGSCFLCIVSQLEIAELLPSSSEQHVGYCEAFDGPLIRCMFSPDALRSWIARNTAIASQRQILMTARGKNVKLQTLATEVRCTQTVFATVCTSC